MSAHAAHVLAGARAPQHWRRALAAASARAHTLAIRAAWLRDAAQPVPRLCGAVLFGDALAASIERLVRRGDGDDASGVRRARVPPPAKRSRDAVTGAADGSARQRAAAVFPTVSRRGVVPATTVAHAPRAGAGAADFARVANRPSAATAARAGAEVAGDVVPQDGAHDAASGSATHEAPSGPPEALPRDPARTQRTSAGDVTSLARTAPEALLARARNASHFASHSSGSRADRAGEARRRPSRDGSPAQLLPSHAAFAAHGDAVAAHGGSTTVPTPPDATRALRARVLERSASARGRFARTLSPGSAIESDWTRSPLGPAAPAHLFGASAALRGATAAAPRADRRAHPAPRAGARAPSIAGNDAAAGTDSTADGAAIAGTVSTAFGATPRDVSPHRAPLADASSGATAAHAADPAFAAAELAGLPPAPFAWPRDAADAVRAHAPGALRRLAAPAAADDGDDELEVLSAKLDRILVAQARRHGVDV
jgi:hypothetical protein